MTSRIVVVGGGLAGAWIARAAREAGFAGPITLLTDERHLPYERPPLSKAGLMGAGHEPLFTQEEYDLLEIEVQCEKHVVAIDRDECIVRCADGSIYPYDRLALATGGRARRPMFPGSDLPGVFTLRTREDGQAIAARLAAGGKALIVGGGWIGLEVAAAARERGTEVTLVESADRLCGRSLPRLMSDYLLAKHRDRGVDILLSASLMRLEQSGGHRLRATLTGGLGSIDEIDLVVLGVGLVPNVELALEAGLAVDNGVVVDKSGRTSDPDIFAAGDLANVQLSCSADRIRLESWAHAQNHGLAVGRAIAGIESDYDELPWFWSDQYDMNIQIAGLFAAGREEVLRGDLANGRFSLFQLENDRIVAVAAVNAARDLKRAKRMILSATSVSGGALADLAIPLGDG